MRRFAAIFLFAFLIGALGLTGCGGDNTEALFGAAAKITLTRVPTNMAPGEVSTVSATVFDSRDNVLSGAPLTYTSSNTEILQVANNGLVCAGKWDKLDSPVVCTPAATGGAVEVTVKAEAISTKFTVYVHKKVTRIDVTSPDAAGCRSQTETRQYNAKVFAGSEDITSQVGPVKFRASAPSVVTIDDTGKATAKNPGVSSIFAEAGGAVSTPVPGNTFETCRVVKISLTIKDTTDTSISQATGASKTVIAELTDSTGKPVLLTNTSELRWVVLNSTVATATPAAAPSDGSAPSVNQATVAGVKPGFTSVAAVCGPRVQDTAAPCNAGLEPVFSNAIEVQTTGTPTVSVYVGDPESDTIIPITSNAAGAAISLKNSAGTAIKPNSMLLSSNGTRLLIGTSDGLVLLDTSNNALTGPVTQAKGKVLAISADASRALLSDDSTDQVTVVAIAQAAVTVLRTVNIADAVAAAFSSDPERVYVANASAIYYLAGNQLPATVPGGASDITTLANGAFAYFAAGSSIPARAVCNNSFATSFASGGARFIRTANDGKRVIAVTPSGLDVITTTGTFETPPDSCLPGANHSRNTITLGSGIVLRDLILTPDSTRAFIVTGSTTLLGYNFATTSPANITLTGSAGSTAGGVSADGALMYIGTTDKNIHRVDLATGADAQQIQVSINPVFVAVRSN